LALPPPTRRLDSWSIPAYSRSFRW
jgi:hypothetical protein